MTDTHGRGRPDSASRIIAPSPQVIYQAFVDPDALVSWLPPAGVTARMHHFDPREGGTYEMALIYNQPDRPAAGKTTQDTDVVAGRFLELIPERRIVQAVEFGSDDPAFAGTMTMIWSLEPVAAGTEITISCKNVPEGITQEDHDAGLRSSLANLAAFVE